MLRIARGGVGFTLTLVLINSRLWLPQVPAIARVKGEAAKPRPPEPPLLQTLEFVTGSMKMWFSLNGNAALPFGNSLDTSEEILYKSYPTDRPVGSHVHCRMEKYDP